MKKALILLLTLCMLITSVPVFAANTGEWSTGKSTYSFVTPGQIKLFKKATKGIGGVAYKPVALLAKQLVSGTNYIYLSYGTTVTLKPECSWYILSAYKNLDKKLSVLRRLTRNSREVRRNMPQISVEYFSPCTDRNSFAYGTGGIYETVSGICRKIDDISDTITVGETVIPIDDISLLVSVSFALIYVRSLSCLESIWHSSFTHPVQQRRGSCLSQPP